MDDKQIKQNLKVQTKFWNAQGGYEKGQAQQFWNSILRCFDDKINLSETIVYEKQVKEPGTNNTKFIDGYITKTRVIIEQKSSHIDLNKPEPQSDGSKLTPFQQAERYDNWLPLNEKARYIVCSNFRAIEIHDRNRPLEPPTIIPFTDDEIEKNYYRLKFLLDEQSSVTALEVAVSKAAAQHIGSLYDDIIKLYQKEELTPDFLHSLNVFCVRLVFCFYAEDALVFRRKDMFGNYMKKYTQSRDEFRKNLKLLFDVLNTPNQERDPDDLALNEFPYVNGGLFALKTPLPRITENIAIKITQKISLGFDWSPINPAIFGAMFESTLSPQARREGGMHYTSTDNIDKAVGTLFLNDLRQKLTDIIATGDINQKTENLINFQKEIASIKVFDPACGSGNFLTYSYMELRRLENKVLYELKTMGVDVPQSPVMVSLSQFYGLEINDFAVDTAKTALWIAQNQMLHETQEILGTPLPELPLSNIDTIHCVNALREDWEKYAPTEEIDYIVGNPPFVGHQWRSEEQKEEMDLVFDGFDTYGKLDYVACWYKKAADFMQHNTQIRCAFVSTNSIVQGESVATMWKPLFEKLNVNIEFAYRTFRWESDSIGMAHVHCVIIGFSVSGSTDAAKMLYNADGTIEIAKNINGYLLNAPNVFIENRGKPLMKGLSKMSKGSQPTDGGNLILSAEEKDELIKIYPQTSSFIRQYISADDFINKKLRYCLWLKGVAPNEYTKIKPIMERLEKVREMRLKSPTASVKRDADIPMLFTQIRQPETDYLVVPEVSSEQRKYIPIGFMSKDIIVSNMIYAVPNASLYLFGVLISKVHMSWMRITAGRLEMRYRYTPAVYNNFPFCNPTKEQRTEIENTAKGILDARALFPNASLADLYNELTMPPELRKAHNKNDKAVMKAYGFPTNASESEMVAKCFEMIGNLKLKIDY